MDSDRCNLLQTEGGSLHVSEKASGVQVWSRAPTVQRKERYSGAKALGLSCSSSSWYLVNSGQPMWSPERDTYSLTKQEKGGRVWEYPEGVVGRMKGRVLPLFSANCFCESRSCQRAVTKSGPHSIQGGLGALALVT